MREIRLNGTQYKVEDTIIHRAISPWIAKIGSGSRTYSDFTTADLEEYHDFRNGIGKDRAVGSEARLQFSEGIDFTTEGQAVLGPKITTAGSFGVAPVKIIDFDGSGSNKTYAIGHNKISEWSGSAWGNIKTGFANPIDAIVVQDGTDKYLIVSSATKSIYTTDGTNWNTLRRDLLTYTEVDTNGKLTVTATKATAADVNTNEDVWLYEDKGVNYFNALDVDFEIYQGSTSDVGGRAGIAITNTVGSINDFAATDISVWATATVGPIYKIEIQRGGAAGFADIDTYVGVANTLYYCTLTRATGSDTCTLTIYSDAGGSTLLATLSIAGVGATTKYQYAYGFVNYNDGGGSENFDGYVQNFDIGGARGYMAVYGSKLYSISTDGNKVNSSVSGDIDRHSGHFELTGDFGTLYGLFEGKLLADGTPVIYFHGTQGLYTIDITNVLAYRQEVQYPPLTNAGRAGMYWNGSVWVSTGFGILKVTPSLATFVGPDQDDGLPSTYQGSVYDMVTVNNWLVYCVNKTLETDRSSIFKRNSSYGGSLQIYTSAANVAITCLYHTPSSTTYPNGRLWFGEGTDVKYMMFPDTTSNVKQISTYTYVDDSGYGKLPIFRKLATITKVALGVAAITKSCDSDDYIEVFYGLNGATPTTSLGTFKSSPHPEILTFNTGLGTEFYTIQLAIKLIRGSTSTNSPELESLLFHWYGTPERISSWTLNMLLTGEYADQAFTDLEAIYDTNILVPFYPSGDPKKGFFKVKLTTMPSREWFENQGGREGVVQIILEEVYNG